MVHFSQLQSAVFLINDPIDLSLHNILCSGSWDLHFPAVCKALYKGNKLQFCGQKSTSTHKLVCVIFF